MHNPAHDSADDMSEAELEFRLARKRRARGLRLVLPPRDLFALARSFPTLANAPAEFFAPFGDHAIGFAGDLEGELVEGGGGAIGFASWVRERGGGGMRDAGLFVLSVWNASDDWREIAGLSRDDGPTGGRFEVHRALGNWDDGHRAAFLAWAAAPWWL